MKYIIHNEKCLKNKNLRIKALELVETQIGRLGRIGDSYSKPIVVDLYFNEGDGSRYQVSAVLSLRGEIIYLKDSGDNIEACLHTLFDRLKLTLSKKISKKRKAYLNRRKDFQRRAFMENIEELQDLKKDKTLVVFQQLLKVISSDVAKYIRRRLKSAEMTTAITKGMFKIQELLNELYLRAYDRFNELPAEESGITAWLYQIADELLQEKFREIEFEEKHFRQLEEFVNAEYRSLEESYTVNADEEIIPIEELDEMPAMNDWYSAEDLVYGENEDSLLDEITLKMNQEEIHMLIEKELAKLPVFKRTIMDLFLINQMSAEEIAEVKRISIDEVDSVIREVNKDLTRRLSILVSST